MSERDWLIEQIRELQEQRKILTNYIAGAIGGAIGLLATSTSPLTTLLAGVGIVGAYALGVWLSFVQRRINQALEDLRKV